MSVEEAFDEQLPNFTSLLDEPVINDGILNDQTLTSISGVDEQIMMPIKKVTQPLFSNTHSSKISADKLQALVMKLRKAREDAQEAGLRKREREKTNRRATKNKGADSNITNKKTNKKKCMKNKCGMRSYNVNSSKRAVSKTSTDEKQEARVSIKHNLVKKS